MDENFYKIYHDIINKPFIKFDQFFDIQFFVKLQNNIIFISQKKQKGYDCFFIKCRKLSKQNWQLIVKTDDNLIKQELLILFSIVSTNFLQIQFDHNGVMKLDIFKKIISLNSIIVKKINDLINNFYVDSFYKQQYKAQLTSEYRKLSKSEKGLVLQHEEISWYLTLKNFHQRLGLNYFDLQKLPYDTYKLLTILMNIQTSIKNQQILALNKKTNSRLR